MINIVYEEYSEKYENEVINLLNICFKGKNINKNSFEWKHIDNYFQGRQKSMIAIDHQKVVAFVCFDPLNIKNKENNYLFYSCSVQATHPDYRRRGIVSDLTQIIEISLPKDTNYLGFSNISGVKIDLHLKRINYQILGQMITRYMISLPRYNGVSVNEVFALNYKILSVNKSQKYELYKNTDYLDWRFYRNPKIKFIFLEITKKGKIIGNAVIRNSFFKCELLCILPLTLELLSDCIKSIKSYAFNKGCLVTSFTYLPNNVWNKFLPKYFFQRNSGVYFTVKTNVKSLLNSENWMIQGGDIQ